jgi:hypothetical protein
VRSHRTSIVTSYGVDGTGHVYAGRRWPSFWASCRAGSKTVGAASQAAGVARGEAGALVLVGLAALLPATTLLAWQLYRQTRGVTRAHDRRGRPGYSTVTLLARFRGLSIDRPSASATW